MTVCLTKDKLMNVVFLSPQNAATRIAAGAVLVDIREAGERRRAHIPGSLHMPLSKGPLKTMDGDCIYYCASGMRTQTSADRLAPATGQPAAILEGGLNAWQKAGMAVVEDRSAPIDIMRQVMIAAGSLVLLGAGLGALINPAFYALSAFVGAGLVFAGVTGICAMARVLSLAPWNR
jgi:rhodanese-related sulfurtransferase